jgi:hypothetical protein
MMESNHASLGILLERFLRTMHRPDAGRTLPILHAAKLTTPQVAAVEFIPEPKDRLCRSDSPWALAASH